MTNIINNKHLEFQQFEVVLMARFLDGDHGFVVRPFSHMSDQDDINLVELFWSVNGTSKNKEKVEFSQMRYDEKEKAKALMYILNDLLDSHKKLETLVTDVRETRMLIEAAGNIKCRFYSDKLGDALNKL